MTSLRRKLWRDLWRIRFQAATIAVLVACGIASFLSAIASAVSLEASRRAFYADARLADVFVHVQRAPRPIRDRLASIAGVSAAQGRLVGEYRLDLPGSTEPVSARFISLDHSGVEQLNRLFIRSGRNVEPGATDEVVLSEQLAEAWNLTPGMTLTAVINGRRARLRIVGTAITAEWVWAPAPRTGFADPVHFGVAFMDETALAKAMGFVGAYNDFALSLSPLVDRHEIVRRIDDVLTPYGGLGAVLAEDQPSVRLVDQKIAGIRRLAQRLPVIFLAVAAFLLNVLLGRIVAAQREQIATLKALGYQTRELLAHYLEFAIVICTLGVVLGLGLGVLGAKALLSMYSVYFRLPAYVLRTGATNLLIAIGATYVAALLGVMRSVQRAVAIPPAEAMRPEPPQTYRRTRLDPLWAQLPPIARIVLRELARRPLRFVMTAGSISLATAIVVAGDVVSDSVFGVLDLQFEVSHREDLTITLDRARPIRAVSELAHVPGVVHAEGERVVPVRLRHGHHEESTAVIGIEQLDMHRLLDAAARPMTLPDRGISISRVLADKLDLQAGDVVDVEVLEGDRRKVKMSVARLVDDLLGMSAYASPQEVAQLLDEPRQVNVVMLSVEHRDLDSVHERLRKIPGVAGMSRPQRDKELVRAQAADVYLQMQIVLVIFATAIAVGVVYNNARIAFELRSRDLATMRILGFTRGELAVMLLSEQAIQIFAGLGPGLRLGQAMGASMLSTIDRELLRVPPTYTTAALLPAIAAVLLAGFASALIVRRRSDHLDLVAVLKARD